MARSVKPVTAKLEWRGIQCRVKHTRKYFDDRDMVEITVVKPKAAILPITETGYRCEFVVPADLKRAGGALGYMAALINGEARSKRWQQRDFELRQFNLFR